MDLSKILNLGAYDSSVYAQRLLDLERQAAAAAAVVGSSGKAAEEEQGGPLHGHDHECRGASCDHESHASRFVPTLGSRWGPARSVGRCCRAISARPLDLPAGRTAGMHMQTAHSPPCSDMTPVSRLWPCT